MGRRGEWAAVLGGVALLASAPARAQNAPPIPPVAPAAQPPERPLSVADGRAIEQALRNASEFAFPAELEGAAHDLASPDPAARANADAALSNAAVTLATDEHGRLANPAAVDPNWALKEPYDAAADFARARADGRIGAWLKSLPRHNPDYLALLAAWKRYDAIRAAGGWPRLPDLISLKGKGKGKIVAKVRARLDKEGYGGPDLSLSKEIAEFQRRHALHATGALNAETIKAMNVPVEERLATIAANLERDRWLPDTLPPERIVADIAAAEVTYYLDGKPVLPMRAIVGDTKHLTPMFASRVSNIVFNPAWHVPSSIAKAELYPKEARSHGYFARNDFSVINGQLVQHAGPKSALGRIKFDMPDPFNVYLHDTPGRALFAVDARGRSHGCVRLEKPKDLALDLLDPDSWNGDRIDAVIAKGDTLWAHPARQVAVFLVYRTAQADGDGPAIFRPDVYGWDSKLNSALGADR
jgi:murein L,D-transpeptidase YcbB/YkuD